MKIRSTFDISVLLMAVLMFSMPFVALAQEVSVQAEAIADAQQDVKTNIDTNLWFLGGCVGGLIIVLFAHIYEPSPPASRFIGKSPEYVAFYTDTYKAEASKLQTSRALSGCITGVVVSAVGYCGLVILAAAAE